MARRGARPGLLAVLAAALVLAGCGPPDAGPTSTPSSAAPTEPTTARSLVAAVEVHLGRPAVLAARISPDALRRQGVDQQVVDGGSTIAVEVALEEPVGDHSHVLVVVTPDTAVYDEDRCVVAGRVHGCEVARDGRTVQRLRWSTDVPQEDPGGIVAETLREDRLVRVTYQGHVRDADLHAGPLADLAEDLVALAADPAVGFTTTPAYASAGDALDDSVLVGPGWAGA